MKTKPNRATRKGGKKVSSTQSAKHPEKSPGKPQPEAWPETIEPSPRTDQINITLSCDGERLFGYTMPLNTSGALRHAGENSPEFMAMFVENAVFGALYERKGQPAESPDQPVVTVQDAAGTVIGRGALPSELCSQACAIARERCGGNLAMFIRSAIQDKVARIGQPDKTTLGTFESVEHIAREIHFLGEAIRAAMRTWNKEGGMTGEHLNEMEHGFYLLNERLFDAIKSELDEGRAAHYAHNRGK